MKALKYAEAIFDFVIRAFIFLSGVLLTLIMLAVCTDVVMRYVFNRPIFWVAELSEYALLYITFLGTAWLLPRNKHISIHIIMARLTEKGKRVLRICHDILGMLLCLAFCYYCGISTWEHYSRNIIDVQAVDVPKAFVIMVIPAGFFLLCLQFVRRLFEDLGIIELRPLETQMETGKGEIK